MNRWMDGWMHRWMNRWTDWWMDRQINRQGIDNGWMDEWMDGWIEGGLEITGWMIMAEWTYWSMMDKRTDGQTHGHAGQGSVNTALIMAVSHTLPTTAKPRTTPHTRWCSYIHVFDVHLRLLLELCDDLTVEFLELWRQWRRTVYISMAVFLRGKDSCGRMGLSTCWASMIYCPPCCKTVVDPKGATLGWTSEKYTHFFSSQMLGDNVLSNLF